MSQAVVALIIWMPVSSALAQAPIVGTVTHIEDGDTICLSMIKIRIEGIDAPETKESCWRGRHRWKCGPPATEKLREMIHRQTVTCEPKYCDRYGRTVATCQLLNGDDIGAVMVAGGWAIDWPYYSGGRYKAAQDAAHKDGRGIWENGGFPTIRMLGRMLRPGSRPNRGPWPPCKKLCDAPIANALFKKVTGEHLAGEVSEPMR